MPDPAARSGIRRDLAAIGVLLGLAAWLFRDHLFGRLTFLGNPDRLNHSLKILKFYVDGLASGGLKAWNEAEMLGYDALAQPYTFPNPFTYLVALGGSENVYVSAGYVSFLLLALAGVAAYAFARRLLEDRGLSLVAAILYQCSALSILKASQNDMSFMAIVLIPVFALLIHRANARNLASSYFLGSLATFALLQFCFLQKAAYVLLFAGAYGLFKAREQRSWPVLATLCGAVLTGLIGAAPRLYGLAVAMGEYVRMQPEENLQTFSDLFRYQGIFGYQILRWFEDGIFGRYFADETARLNGLNLSEGFLLYSSPMVPFLILLAMLSARGGWNGSALGRPSEPRFLLWFMLFTFAAALLKPVSFVMHLLFLKVDFVHARILVVGLLPMVLYAALYLRQLRPEASSAMHWREYVRAAALTLAALLLIESLAGAFRGSWIWKDLLERSFSAPALVRIGASAAVFAGFLLVLRRRVSWLSPKVAFHALCATLAAQAVLGAEFRLNGEHTRGGEVPFRNGDIYFAGRDEFRVPSAAERANLHARIERDRYRSVVVCDPKSAGGFCAAHIAQFWNLRLADGYYGIGVPARIAMLPWTTGLGLRHIIFTSPEQLPWGLLGFLNVKYALINDARLYRNRKSADSDPWPKMVANPSPVVPRAFFAAEIRAARSASDARDVLFDGAVPRDATRISAVEDVSDSRKLTNEGNIRIATRADHMELSVDPAGAERFLVINELFSTRWSASVDGKQTTIHPTNVVMRGVFVPPGATKVTLTYTPTVRTTVAHASFAIATLMLLAIAFLFWKQGRRRATPA